MKHLEKLLRGLGNRRRLAILQLILKHKRLSVGDLAAGIKLSFRSTSRHLRLMRQLELLDHEQYGITVYYFLSPIIPKPARTFLKYLPHSHE